MEFEWDENKAHSNVVKHGVRFEEAAEAFFNPFNYYGDATVGETAPTCYWVLFHSALASDCFLERGDEGERTRIVSARLATAAERKTYE